MSSEMDAGELAAHVADANRVLYEPCMRGQSVAASTVRGLLAGIRQLRDENERLKGMLALHRFDGEAISTREAIRDELIHAALARPVGVGQDPKEPRK